MWIITSQLSPSKKAHDDGVPMLSQETGIGVFYNQLFEAVTFLIKVCHKVENKVCFPISFLVIFRGGLLSSRKKKVNNARNAVAMK